MNKKYGEKNYKKNWQVILKTQQLWKCVRGKIFTGIEKIYFDLFCLQIISLGARRTC